MRKPSRKTLRKKADKLWSKIIRSRIFCEVCGREANNPHHIISRRNLGLRHDLKNGILLCSCHHTFCLESAHQDPLWFMEWLKSHRFGDYKYLMKKRTQIVSKPDYEAIIYYLESYPLAEELDAHFPKCECSKSNSKK